MALILLESLALVGAAGVLVVKTVGGRPGYAVRALPEPRSPSWGRRRSPSAPAALLRLRPAARSPIVVLQLLALPVAYSLWFQAGRAGYGAPIMVVAVAVLFLCSRPREACPTSSGATAHRATADRPRTSTAELRRLRSRRGSRATSARHLHLRHPDDAGDLGLRLVRDEAQQQDLALRLGERRDDVAQHRPLLDLLEPFVHHAERSGTSGTVSGRASTSSGTPE